MPPKRMVSSSTASSGSASALMFRSTAPPIPTQASHPAPPARLADNTIGERARQGGSLSTGRSRARVMRHVFLKSDEVESRQKARRPASFGQLLEGVSHSEQQSLRAGLREKSEAK